MFELLTLIAISLAIAALATTRGTRTRLEWQIEELKREIKRLSEQQAGVPQATMQASAEDQAGVFEEPAPAGEEIVGATEQAAEELAMAAETEAVPEQDFPAEEPKAPAKPKESFESMLAARWSVWVGGLALAFAGIFAVKYSIDQGLFSPEVRLFFAGAFGLVLFAAGEFMRRRTGAEIAQTFANAMIPGILTAAGSLTLMGTIYAAHGIYEFIGPASAFVLLGAVSLATLALSLLHGQGLAGLGLLASFATPLLVTSENPNPSALFGFLAIVWIGSALAARIRDWRVSPAIANAGLSIWALVYMSASAAYVVWPVTLAVLIMLAGTAFLWPGAWRDPQPAAVTSDEPVADEAELVAEDDGRPAEPLKSAKPVRVAGPWERLLLPAHIANTLTSALGAASVAVLHLSPAVVPVGNASLAFALLVAALGILGALRTYALYPAVMSAVATFGGLRMLIETVASETPQVPVDGEVPLAAFLDPSVASGFALALAAFFVVLGIALAFARREESPHGIALTIITTATPLLVAAGSFVFFGNYAFDGRHGLFAIAGGLAWLATAEFAFRGEAYLGRYVLRRDLFVGASWAAFVGALLVMTNDLATTLGAAFLGFVYLLARKARDWPILPWGMAASAVFVAGRIAWEPTIVGAANLSTTPVFNQLLVGYGVPTLLLIASAWLVRRSDDTRMRSAMEALASLFSLLTLGILVRHAMNGGVLNDAVPSLGEQAIYTLLTVGASATMMSLDLRRPSIVFRFGSMAVGYLSMISVIGAHYVGLNPYFTGELTGRIPFFNLLFLAYLLPGIAYGALAWFAVTRRPQHYVVALALTGASLLFAYVSLSVRRVYHGESIADWKGFLQPELYTYSAVWLVLGIALLFAGYRFRSKALRIASAVLVLLTVVKVFLIDMAHLEGLLRVVSFIGLGVALIGIGRFYQKILVGLGEDERPAEPTDAEPAGSGQGAG